MRQSKGAGWTRRTWWRARAPRCAACCLLAASMVSPVVGASEEEVVPGPPPEVESTRLDNDAYYAGLIDLKLLSLLEWQLRHHPPQSPLTELLLRRQVRLAALGDAWITVDQRREILAEANTLLEAVIRDYPDDERTFDWRLALARSLIYEEAEPHYTGILYREGTPADREILAALTDRAIAQLTALIERLEVAYTALDDLSVAEYERLDDEGAVQRLEAAMPQAAYLMCWARFYRAVACPRREPSRRALLESVLADLYAEPALLRQPHAVTHVRAQSLILAGMINRRLSNRETALRQLEDAVAVARRVPDAEERRDLAWVVLLGSIERVRALRDAGDFNTAQQAIAVLRDDLSGPQGVDFGRKLVIALLESSVEQARVAGMNQPNAALADAAMQPLVRLAQEQPAYRDEVYAVIYGMLSDTPRPDRLHPFQQCALVAGQIAEATRLRIEAEEATTEHERATRDERAVGLLEDAVQLATAVVAGRGRIAPELYCESLYNLAVGQFHLGRRLEAARHFRAAATDCPRFNRALPAATYAVEIAAQLAQDASIAGREDVQRLYVDALQTLIDGFGDSQAAGYWRFFYAQALADFGQLDRAADEYGRVDDSHPQAIVARFRSVRCQVESLKASLGAGGLNGSAVQLRVSAIRRAAEFLKALVSKAGESGAGPTMDLQRLLAESDVIIAELDVMPEVAQEQKALTRLEGFESSYAVYPDLLGRVLRIRIVAYEATGQLDAARQTVPAYIASAPEEAGRTLQALFDATWSGFTPSLIADATPESRAKARSALLFAEQLEAWAVARADELTPYDRYVLRVQRAEAALAAGDTEEALDLFEDALAREAGLEALSGPNPRTVMGTARALDALQRHEEALAWYNRAYLRAAPASALRFQALLGDLRCRHALGTPSSTLRAIIAQHRVLQPEMGGADLKAAFQALERSWSE